MIERPLKCALLFRLLEFILCATCLGLTIHMLNYNTKSKALFIYIISLITAAFLFATILDLVALCTPTKIPWTIWLLICAMAACLFFYACGYLTAVVQYVKTSWYWIYVTVFGFTGFIFLLELLCLIGLVIRYYVQKTPTSSCVPVDYDTKVIQQRQVPPVYLKRVHEKKAIIEEEIEEVKEEETEDEEDEEKEEEKETVYLQSTITQTICTCPKNSYEKLDRLSISNKNENEKTRTIVKKKSTLITSHGGTFHVSKQIAPLPSPPPCRCKTFQPASTQKLIEEQRRWSRSPKPLEKITESNERKISTAPVETSKNFDSRSSFRHQSFEKVQIHSMPELTEGAEIGFGDSSKERKQGSNTARTIYVSPTGFGSPSEATTLVSKTEMATGLGSPSEATTLVSKTEMATGFGRPIEENRLGSKSQMATGSGSASGTTRVVSKSQMTTGFRRPSEENRPVSNSQIATYVAPASFDSPNEERRLKSKSQMSSFNSMSEQRRLESKNRLATHDVPAHFSAASKEKGLESEDQITAAYVAPVGLSRLSEERRLESKDQMTNYDVPTDFGNHSKENRLVSNTQMATHVSPTGSGSPSEERHLRSQSLMSAHQTSFNSRTKNLPLGSKSQIANYDASNNFAGSSKEKGLGSKDQMTTDVASASFGNLSEERRLESKEQITTDKVPTDFGGPSEETRLEPEDQMITYLAPASFDSLSKGGRLDANGQMTTYVAPTGFNGPNENRNQESTDQTVSQAGSRGYTGMTYQCTRCGCPHKYVYAQPSAPYPTIPSTATSTKVCCPCPKAVRESILLTKSPSASNQQVLIEESGAITSESGSDSDHGVVVPHQRTSLGAASDRRSSGGSQSRYNTSFTKDNDSVNRSNYR